MAAVLGAERGPIGMPLGIEARDAAASVTVPMHQPPTMYSETRVPSLRPMRDPGICSPFVSNWSAELLMICDEVASCTRKLHRRRLSFSWVPLYSISASVSQSSYELTLTPKLLLSPVPEALPSPVFTSWVASMIFARADMKSLRDGSVDVPFFLPVR